MIALDTGFLIYGTQAQRHRQGDFSRVQQSRVSLAVGVLDELLADGKTFVIPAPAAWEYVLDFDVADQPEVWRGFSAISVAPFDVAAARIASQISRRYSDRIANSSKAFGNRPAAGVGARQQMKVDIQIVAIAIAQRAEAIYTLEVEKFSEWAGGAIRVVGLPMKSSA